MTSYPEYKSSGVDWLGEIPTHWQASRLKMFSKIYSGGTPDTKEKKYWENGTVPWIASGEVNQELITEVTTYITKEALKNSSAKWIPKNAIVMALAGQGRTKGTVALTGVEVTCNQSLAAIVTKNTNYKYLFYWLKSKYQDIRGLVGEDRDGLNLDLIGAISIPIPLLAEQQKIVDFLDYKMGQCDRFISNRQKQIELLNEQKAAIINKAVTKGINPNAKMKPSGIEWIGDIPEHWCIWKMTRICEKIGDGLHGTPVYEEGSGIFFVNGNNLSNGKIEINENTKEVESKNFNLIKKEISFGSVLYSINGTIGNIAIYNGENILLGKSAAFFVCRNTIINMYLFHYLISNSVLIYLHSTTEGTTIKNVSLDTLRSLGIPLSSIEEQKSILDFIKKETSKIETLISKYQKQIELMQEYRTTLISQAVTGKIDVRDWKPPTK
jgi:type I restriction enzyme S subunit